MIQLLIWIVISIALIVCVHTICVTVIKVKETSVTESLEKEKLWQLKHAQKWDNT